MKPPARTAAIRKALVHTLTPEIPKPDPATYQLKVQKTILAKIQKQAAALGYKLLPTALVPA